MEILQTLAVAASLGSLAGINLYLTVFVAGLAIHNGWIHLPPPLAGLQVLENPVILWLAAGLYCIEFFADKVPWVDSLWDALHTIIRPLGAVVLAIAAIGDAHPAFEVAGALLAGSLAMGSHVAKAGTRLAVNASPEPVSNILLSLLEDGLVLGGLGILAWSPLVAAALALILFGVLLSRLPALFRFLKSKLRAGLGKIRSSLAPWGRFRP
jgi:hypothetical protein